MSQPQKPSQSEQVRALTDEIGVLRARDLASKGIPRAVLKRLCNQGELIRTGRGLYVSAIGGITENHSLAAVARQVPKGVICLLSALRFHGLTTQLPPDVWLAIPSQARRPKGAAASIRPVHFSGKALTAGVEEHLVEKVAVRIYGPAKTVADCFKFRNSIGTDVAIEALREFLRQSPQKTEALLRHARVDRVERVIRPYLESLA